jgi:F0F1-type ATP synthase membrane subunit c/vacuolar-type H+-ATPase subunit K
MPTPLRGLLIGLAMLVGAVLVVEITSAFLEERAEQNEDGFQP